MTSNIDATKPIDGAPASKSDLRANLAAAKSEIEALQNSLSSVSMRNRILNPMMRFDRRNSGASVLSVSGTTVYGPDRWKIVSTPSSPATFTIQQQSSGGPSDYPYYVRVTTSVAKASPVAGDLVGLMQEIEGVNWYDMKWGTVSALSTTLSFWVRGSIAGLYNVALNGVSGAYYTSEFRIIQANVWEQKSIVIPPCTIGTFTASNVRTLSIRFALSAGSSYVGSLNSWSGTQTYMTAVGTRLGDTASATLDITAVQLEPGSAVTSFDRRMDTTEAVLTGRYYETGNFTYSLYGTAGMAISFNVPYMFPKRATPTVLITSAPTNVSPYGATAQTANFYTTGTVTGTGVWSWSSAWSADAEI